MGTPLRPRFGEDWFEDVTLEPVTLSPGGTSNTACEGSLANQPESIRPALAIGFGRILSGLRTPGADE